MSTTINLGRVVGDGATINDVNNLELQGSSDGIIYTQVGGNINIVPDITKVQSKVTGNAGEILGFDADGNVTTVPLTYELYGMELDMDETYGPNMVRYMSQNANFQPAHMDYTTGQFDYGDWADAFFIKNLRPCMLNYDGSVAYDLMKSDYTKKVDGSASDIANDSFGGNAMVGIPTVWVKVDTSTPRKPKFYIASTQLDSTYKAYAHHDSNGNIMPYTYLPIYNGWKDGSGRIRSISGKTPTGNETAANQITECRANNVLNDDSWDIEKFVDRQLINLLLMMISKTTDSQTAFGNGNCNGKNNPSTGTDSYGRFNSGTMNANGLFWGSNADNLGVKVFGMEHYWGNYWRQYLGLALSNGEIYYKLTSGTEDGSTVQGFNTEDLQVGSTNIESKWIHGFSSPGLTGSIDDVEVTEYGLIPSSVGGSYDQKYYDQVQFSESATGPDISLVGADDAISNMMGVGAFTTRFSNNFSYSAHYINASPSCKPKKNVKHTLKIVYMGPEGDPLFLAPPTVTQKLLSGETYSVTSPSVIPFNPDISVVSGTMGDQDVTIIVTYTRRQATLTITYTGPSGFPAPSQVVQTVNVGDTYSVTSPTVTNYTPDIAIVSGTMVDGGVSKTVTYTRNTATLRITYVGPSGDTSFPTPSQVVQTVNVGDSYSVSSPSVTNYTPDKATVSGTMTSAGVNETVTYTRDTATLRITYTGPSGFPAPSQVVQTVNVGATYSVTSPSVTGYTPDKAVVSGTMTSAGVNETVIYTAATATLTIHYIDNDTGRKLYDDYVGTYNVGQYYSVNSPAYLNRLPYPSVVSGYMVAGGVEVDVVYIRRDFTLSIDYVEPTKNSLFTAPASVSKKVKAGDTYSVTSPTVSGYSPDKAVVSGTMPEEDVNVTVTYTATATLTIYYRKSNGSATAASTYTGIYKVGESYSVTSPTVAGLEPDKDVVTGTMVAGGKTEYVTYNYTGGFDDDYPGTGGGGIVKPTPRPYPGDPVPIHY